MHKRLLVADDSPLAKTTIRKLLVEREDWELIEAADGIEAVDKAKNLHPDLAIVDIVMPRVRTTRGCREPNHGGCGPRLRFEEFNRFGTNTSD
jgi:DNA-binding NarL/FixJ family response regulator